MFYQILDSEKVVISGSDPAQPNDFSLLKSLGVKFIISLQMETLEFLFRGYRNKEAIAALEKGMLPIHIMMSNFSAPTFKEIHHTVELLKHGNAYFHCRRGKDRTGIIRAVYRVKVQNWNVDDAWNEMCELGHAKHLYFWWHKHLLNYLSEN